MCPSTSREAPPYLQISYGEEVIFETRGDGSEGRFIEDAAQPRATALWGPGFAVTGPGVLTGSRLVTGIWVRSFMHPSNNLLTYKFGSVTPTSSTYLFALRR